MAEPEPIAIDLVTPGEVTKLRLGSRTAKQLQAQAKESPRPDVARRKRRSPLRSPPPRLPAPEPAAPARRSPSPSRLSPSRRRRRSAQGRTAREARATEGCARRKAGGRAARSRPPCRRCRRSRAKKLDEMLKEQQRQAEEQKKLEEEKRQVEEEKRKLEEEKKKLEEETKQAEDKRRQEEEERKQAELKKKQEDEKRRKEAELKKKREGGKAAQGSGSEEEIRCGKDFGLAQQDAGQGRAATLGAARRAGENPQQGPVLGAPEGRDQQLSASELAILAQIIKSCVQSKWNVLGGGRSAQNTQVKLRLRFNPDGRLAAEPQIMNPQNTPTSWRYRDSALRAVQACEPYSLPPAKYDFWKDIVLNFDPRDMF